MFNSRVYEKQLVVSIRPHRFQMAPAFANGEDFSEGIFTSRDWACYGKELAPGTETAQSMGTMPKQPPGMTSNKNEGEDLGLYTHTTAMWGVGGTRRGQMPPTAFYPVGASIWATPLVRVFQQSNRIESG